MKFVFFGTPEFAAIILDKLIKAGLIPQAVVCNPDRPTGRKQIITPPPVKSLTMKHEALNIPVLQPEKLDKDFMLQASSFMPDVFIVAAYAKVLPKEILEIPRLGSIGVHPSLLPEYRGATPIQSAILNGEKKTGVALFLMDEKVDHGPIIADCKLQIADSNYEKSSEYLANIGGDLLIETLPKFLAGEIKPEPQDESKATYTKKFRTEDAYIEPRDLEKAQNEGGEIAVQIERKIRALNPEPGTWTIIDHKRIKFLEAKIIEGKIKLKKIQKEGEKPITL